LIIPITFDELLTPCEVRDGIIKMNQQLFQGSSRHSHGVHAPSRGSLKWKQNTHLYEQVHIAKPTRLSRGISSW